MNDAIDDFHDLKELLNENGFRISDVEFEHDPEVPPHNEFSVEMDLYRTE